MKALPFHGSLRTLLRNAAYLLVLATATALVALYWPLLAGIWRTQALTFVAAIAVMMCGTLVQARSFLAFLDTRSRILWRHFAGIWAISALANYVAPLQPGIAVRVAWLRHHGVGVTDSLLATWRQLMVSLWISILGLAVGLFLTGAPRARWPAAGLFAMWVAALALRRLWLGWLHRLARPQWLARRKELLHRAATGVTPAGVAGVLVQYILGSVLVYWVYGRFGASLDLGQAIIVCCLTYVSSVIAILPANLGITEAIYMFGGHQFGLGIAQAGAMAILIRAAHVSANALLALLGRIAGRLWHPVSTPPWQGQLCALPVERVVHCLLCDNASGKEDRAWQAHLALSPPYGVSRCPGCGLRWLSPRPTAQGYEALYSNTLYFGGAGASPSDYQAEAKSRVGYWHARIRAAAGRLQDRRPLSFLDYGAATGEFVRAALEEGHACTGIELSADARTSAKTRNGVSLLAPAQIGQIDAVRFDVIHMNHVLEHMPDPLSHLRWCAARLNHGGLLLIEVPQQFDNDLDRARRWLGVGGKRRQMDAYSLHHTYFFTPTTLCRLLGKAGFTVEHMTTFNRNKTPWWPPKARNWVLRLFLATADRLHRGGNMIEVYARVNGRASEAAIASQPGLAATPGA